VNSQPLVTVTVGQGECCPPHRWLIARVEETTSLVERWSCQGCGEVRERPLRRFQAVPKRLLSARDENLAGSYAGYEPHEAPSPLAN
jgi:hypothetical protein